MKLLIFLITLSSFSQIKTASIEYNLTIGEDDLYSNGDLKVAYKNAAQNANQLVFKLNVNEKEICFFSENKLENSDSGVELAKIFSGSKNPFYMLLNTNKIYQSFDDLILGKYTVEKQISKYEWKLENESKIISGFKCFKAVTTDVVQNRSGKFNFLITAWYCPEIPIPYGPLLYNGLPGLILELNRRNVVYGATKIDLNPKEILTILKPDLSIIKTEEEITKMREDYINSIKD